jgi:hypothetical protein
MGDVQSVLKEVCDERHKAYDQFFKNDKESITLLLKNQTEMLLIQGRQTEVNDKFTQMFQKQEEDSKWYRDTIMQLIAEKKSDEKKKVVFWETANGKLLFKTLLILLVALVVGALGLNLADALQAIKG